MAQTFPIVEKLGGRQATFEKLKATGHKIETVHAIRMWIARGQIAGDAQRLLMAECDRTGVPYTAADFEVVDVPEETPTENGAAA